MFGASPGFSEGAEDRCSKHLSGDWVRLRIKLMRNMIGNSKPHCFRSAFR
jgi:hypothetical protein